MLGEVCVCMCVYVCVHVCEQILRFQYKNLVGLNFDCLAGKCPEHFS